MFTNRGIDVIFRASAFFIICVYAPIEAVGPGEAEDFYELLMAALGHMQRADELVVLGDFNARVGCGDR